MQCSEFEIRLCDYLDGTLDETARLETQQHASECPLCAALLADSAAVTAFLERVPDLAAPPELASRILSLTQSLRSALGSAAGGWRRWFQPLFQPRFVMGMAMTILSVSMLSRVAGLKIRQLEAADLNPVSIWQGIDNQAHRIWSRGLKFYQNLRFIYEITAQLRALGSEEDQARETEGGESADSPAGNPQTELERRRLEPSAGPGRKR